MRYLLIAILNIEETSGEGMLLFSLYRNLKHIQFLALKFNKMLLFLVVCESRVWCASPTYRYEDCYDQETSSVLR